MRELAAKIIKKVTLEVIYEAVEERTGKIEVDISELKDKQEQDFRYLNRRIDDMGGQLNQRIDTVIQMLMDMNRQLVEIAKQKN